MPQVRNIRAYLLTTLFNALLTMNNHYQAEVQHDFGFILVENGLKLRHIFRHKKTEYGGKAMSNEKKTADW